MRYCCNKVIKINIPLFWKNIGVLSIVPGVLIIGFNAIMNQFQNISWIILISLIVVYTLLYVLGMYFFIMNDYEKDIIRGPVRKIKFMVTRS